MERFPRSALIRTYERPKELAQAPRQNNTYLSALLQLKANSDKRADCHLAPGNRWFFFLY